MYIPLSLFFLGYFLLFLYLNCNGVFFYFLFCRTDNAVKNRFSTLCKKKAKREALAKENTKGFINVNNKRILIDNNGFHSQSMMKIASPLKKLRYYTIKKNIINFLNHLYSLLTLVLDDGNQNEF